MMKRHAEAESLEEANKLAEIEAALDRQRSESAAAAIRRDADIGAYEALDADNRRLKADNRRLTEQAEGLGAQVLAARDEARQAVEGHQAEAAKAAEAAAQVTELGARVVALREEHAALAASATAAAEGHAATRRKADEALAANAQREKEHAAALKGSREECACQKARIKELEEAHVKELEAERAERQRLEGELKAAVRAAEARANEAERDLRTMRELMSSIGQQIVAGAKGKAGKENTPQQSRG